jgi:hypothetical protein
VWTAHEHIDVTNLVAGQHLLLTGHKFAVQRMEFTSAGDVRADPRPGHDFMAGVSEVDLRLVHLPWKGCPAVEPPDKRMSKPWREALADLRGAALRILAHPDTTPDDAAFLRAQLAPLVELDSAEGEIVRREPA